MSARYPDAIYVNTDPFFGDESELTCRTVAIRTARKAHKCYSMDGKQDHEIKPGDRYRFEQARVDGSFWGSYRICLACMDRLLIGDNMDEDDDDAEGGAA